jgi:frataxin-like iron-binding protein CyaY
MWLAADRKAWHFRYDGAQWLCPKTGDELFTRLNALVSDKARVQLKL